MTRPVVIDASAVVDLVIARAQEGWVREQIQNRDLVAPAHMHHEALNTIGKLVRRDEIATGVATAAIETIARMPVELEPLPALLRGAWERRDQHSLPDAIYVELAAQLDTVVITTDRRLARATSLAVAPPEE